jgi:hypothetical protein
MDGDIQTVGVDAIVIIAGTYSLSCHFKDLAESGFNNNLEYAHICFLWACQQYDQSIQSVVLVGSPSVSAANFRIVVLAGRVFNHKKDTKARDVLNHFECNHTTSGAYICYFD